MYLRITVSNRISRIICRHCRIKYMYFCLLVGLGIWLYLLLLCIRLSEVYIIKDMSSRIFISVWILICFGYVGAC